MKKLSLALTALLLCQIMLLQSCKSDTANDGITGIQDNIQTESAAEETTIDPYPDNLPDDLRLNGAEVTFLYREEVCDEFYTEAQNGDIVNDAIYESIKAVEERLDTDIVLKTKAGHLSAARQPYKDHVTNTVLAGDDIYDWVDLMFGAPPGLMVNGIFTDLCTVEHIDLSKPYYIANLADTVAIDGHVYFLGGDISLGYLKCIFCMYFNKQIAENYGIDDLYEIVNDGKWTIEKLMEVTEIASDDLNGDGVYDINDRLGFLIHDQNHRKGFWASSGIRMYTPDPNGEYAFTFGSERDAEICGMLHSLIYETKGTYFPNISNSQEAALEQYNKLTSKFVSGEVFITTAEMDHAVANLRTMEDAYGILPYPKRNEEQDEYGSSSRNTHNAFCMPVTCSDTSAAGAVMEALSSAKYSTVTSTYFETALKVKYSHDEQSAVMYDLIRDTMYLDFGYTYNTAIGSPESVYANSITTKDSIASNVAAKGPALQTSLEKYLEQVRDGNNH
nr:hypothetical protein [Clostridia bacterium]